MLYSTIPTPAGLAVYLAGSLTETRPDTAASFVPSSSRAPSQLPEGRDLDWEDYDYQQDPAAGGGQQGDLDNPLAALLAGIPDFNIEELEALLRDLPVPDDTSQHAGMTMAEAVEVSDMHLACRHLACRLYNRLYTMVYSSQ